MYTYAFVYSPPGPKLKINQNTNTDMKYTKKIHT